jgi:23S rRNA pseudouridine1911/1915/1917 synthase
LAILDFAGLLTAARENAKLYREENMKPGKRARTGEGLRRLPQGVLLYYEDRDLLVIGKPAGLLSIAAGGERDRTAYWIISEYLRKKGEKCRAAAVHRLDRDTSGLMIFAKSERIKKQFMERWNELLKERRYICLAEGEFAEKEGTIAEPLGEDRGGRVVVMKGGKPALTRWKLLNAGNSYSLLALELDTGRRNQIRAHLDWAGHPVAGDKKYHAKTDPLKRLALHADRLVFIHPAREGRAAGALMEFELPAPESFRRVFS